MRARSRRLDEASLVRLADGSYALAAAGRVVWHPERGFVGPPEFGDDGLDLGSLGNLGDSASSAASGLSSGLGSLTSGAPDLSSVEGAAGGLVSQGAGALGGVTGAASGLLGQAEGVAQGLTSSPSSAISTAQGLASSVLPGQAGAIGTAAGLAQQGAAVLADPSSLTPQQAIAAGMNVLTTVSGANNAAAGIMSAALSGDWAGAGAQALKAAQAAAQGSSSDALKMAGEGAAKAMAVGASVGTVVPIIGNVVGAIIGAIYGFVTGLADYLDAQVLGADNDLAVSQVAPIAVSWAAGVQAGGTGGFLYPGQKPGDRSVWFGTAKNAGTTLDNTDQHGNHLPVVIPKTDTTRESFWRNFVEAGYPIMLGSGGQANLHFATGSDAADVEPTLQAWLSGKFRGTQDSPQNKPVMDLALFLARQPDALKILAAAPQGIQGLVMPLMPMAIATLLYMPFVPVLAAAGCYSPRAIKATRIAATTSAAKAGQQVAGIVSQSFPSDDLSTLVHAFLFCAQNSPLFYLVERKGMWALDGTVIKALATIIGQCAFARASGSLSVAQSLLETELKNESKLTVIYPGETLHPGDSRASDNGKYKLTFQTDGNVVLYQGTQPRWASNTNGKPAKVLVMQPDGNLVLYKDGGNTAGNALWSTQTSQYPGSYAALQDDGNLVIYDTARIAHWDAGVHDGSEDRGISLNPKEHDLLMAALTAASKKPVVTDCLAGKTDMQIAKQVGLSTLNAHAISSAKVASKQRHATAAKAAAASALAVAKASKAGAKSVTPPPLVTKKELLAGGASIGVGAAIFFFGKHLLVLASSKKG
jgi:hypothetical protein